MPLACPIVWTFMANLSRISDTFEFPSVAEDSPRRFRPDLSPDARVPSLSTPERRQPATFELRCRCRGGFVLAPWTRAGAGISRRTIGRCYGSPLTGLSQTHSTIVERALVALSPFGSLTSEPLPKPRRGSDRQELRRGERGSLLKGGVRPRDRAPRSRSRQGRGSRSAPRAP